MTYEMIHGACNVSRFDALNDDDAIARASARTHNYDLFLVNANGVGYAREVARSNYDTWATGRDPKLNARN